MEEKENKMPEKNIINKIKEKLLQFGEDIIITDLGRELVLKGRTTDYKKSKLISEAEFRNLDA